MRERATRAVGACQEREGERSEWHCFMSIQIYLYFYLFVSIFAHERVFKLSYIELDDLELEPKHA